MGAKKAEKKVTKTILAVTNFSKSSTNAIVFASNLFANRKLKLLLLNIFENPDETKNMLILINDILGKESEKGLKKQSVEIKALLKDRNLDISVYSMTGKLEKVINTINQTQNIDLMVAGMCSGKYSNKGPENLPMLFMGLSKYPVLLLPENYSDGPVKNILVLNLESDRERFNVKRYFEYIINQDYLTGRIININEKKIDNEMVASLQRMLAMRKEKTDIIIVTPPSGNSIDRAVLELKVDKLSLITSSLLNL